MPLILKRRKEEWIEIVHGESGKSLMIQVCRLFLDDDPHGDAPSVSLRFVDAPRNFEVYRPEHPKTIRRRDMLAKEGT